MSSNDSVLDKLADEIGRSAVAGFQGRRLERLGNDSTIPSSMRDELLYRAGHAAGRSEVARDRIIDLVKATPHRAIRIGRKALVVTVSEVDGRDRLDMLPVTTTGRHMVPA
jgi:hypothetical protein